MARRQSERLSLEACREILGDAASSLPDMDLERLRDQMYALASAAIHAFKNVGHDSFGSVATELATSERVDVEERAAILEFDGKLSRNAAERLALAEQFRRTPR
jgi:hypothetical protein